MKNQLDKSLQFSPYNISGKLQGPRLKIVGALGFWNWKNTNFEIFAIKARDRNVIVCKFQIWNCDNSGQE